MERTNFKQGTRLLIDGQQFISMGTTYHPANKERIVLLANTAQEYDNWCSVKDLHEGLRKGEVTIL